MMLTPRPAEEIWIDAKLTTRFVVRSRHRRREQEYEHWHDTLRGLLIELKISRRYHKENSP